VRDAAGAATLSTWWYPNDKRRPDVGLRLDYALLSASYRGLVRSSAIHPEVGGSDHCPVSITLDIDVAPLRPASSPGQRTLL
jgi:exodeoxyribonuclease-3